MITSQKKTLVRLACKIHLFGIILIKELPFFFFFEKTKDHVCNSHIVGSFFINAPLLKPKSSFRTTVFSKTANPNTLFYFVTLFPITLIRRVMEYKWYYTNGNQWHQAFNNNHVILLINNIYIKKVIYNNNNVHIKTMI